MIKCAAVLYQGKIYTGRSHDDALDKIKGYDSELPKQKGFLTESGTFLDRDQAAEHAVKCKQVSPTVKVLYSYDLN